MSERSEILGDFALERIEQLVIHYALDPVRLSNIIALIGQAEHKGYNSLDIEALLNTLLDKP